MPLKQTTSCESDEGDRNQGFGKRCIRAGNLNTDNFAAPSLLLEMPVIRLKHVRWCFIRGCSASPGMGTCWQVEGEESDKIRALGNNLCEAGKSTKRFKRLRSNTVFESGNRILKA